MAENIAGKAVITGAGQGIGRAVALRLAAGGMHTVLVGRTAEKLERVAAEISEAGGAASVETLDVTDGKAVLALAGRLGERVDVLVNSAGEALIKTVDETSDADWARILTVNLTAPFLMTRALLPLLRQSDNASIINIGSKTAHIGVSEVAAYSAAKTGLLGFTRALAAELKPEGIRAVLLSPGPADTPMRWAATPDYDRSFLIQPEAVAEMVWHLINLPRGTTTGDILLQAVNFL